MDEARYICGAEGAARLVLVLAGFVAGVLALFAVAMLTRKGDE